MLALQDLQNGLVIPVDKPRQWTSFQVVGKVRATVRRLYGVKNIKVGHAGTLDPLATGLLLVCVGKATKQIATLQDGDKVYTGTMVLGATTPCFDLEQAIDHYYPYQHITPQLVAQTAQQFVGTIMQVPPMFSAVKVDGQRAYQYARTDDPTVLIKPKPVQVHAFEVTAFRPGQSATEPCESITTDHPSPDHPHIPYRAPHLYSNPQGSVPAHLPQIDFSIACGKGTYIRSLARDLGVAMGSGAYLAALRRQSIGSHTVGAALPPDRIEEFFAH